MFGFQKLDVYRCAVMFLGVASTLAERVPRGHSALADQLRRAALSVRELGARRFPNAA
jgi:hypothetical protein